MTKLLYITANPKATDQSFSLSVAEAFLDACKSQNPDLSIERLDLYTMNLPEIDTDVFSGWGKLQQGNAFEALSSEEQRKVAAINAMTDQFLAADQYVFVTPMWNLSIPPRMKMYIDNIVIAGKTFRYTENGPTGLLGGKPAIHIQARGGVYSEGPATAFEFGDSYMRAVLGFIGLNVLDSIIIEGMAAMPNEANSIKDRAIALARERARDLLGATTK